MMITNEWMDGRTDRVGFNNALAIKIILFTNFFVISAINILWHKLIIIIVMIFHPFCFCFFTFYHRLQRKQTPEKEIISFVLGRRRHTKIASLRVYF